MDICNLKLYLQYKLSSAGMPMVDNAGRPKLCADGEQLIAEGGWNDPKNAEQFGSAVTQIHVERGLTGPYEEPCESCVREYDANNQSPGCVKHLYNRRIFRTGNPRRDPDFQRALKRHYRAKADYVPQGDTAVTPFEVQRIRKYLLEFSDDTNDLAFYASFLLGVSLFLRAEELCNIKVAHFNPALTKYNDNGNVEGLGVRFKSKDGRYYTRMIIWANNSLPELCPIRHLLAYVSKANITRGYVFRASIKDHKVPMSYAALNSRVQRVCGVTVRDRDGVWGTHVMRKTGYSFAVWGKAEMVPLAKSARHKNPKDAAKYLQDSDTQLELAKFDPEMRAIIDLMPQWRPIHIENLSQAAARAGIRRDDLHTVADEFMRSMVGLLTDRQMRIDNIAAKIIVDPATNLGPREQLNELLAKNVAPDVAAKLQRVVGRLLLDAANGRALRADQESGREDDNEVDEPDISSVGGQRERGPDHEEARPAANLPDRPRRRGGSIDAPSRSNLRNKELTGADRIKVILDIAKELEGVETRQLTEACRNFKVTSLDPIMGCLNNHCNGDVDMFLEKWNPFQHSRFGTKCCKGTLSVCSSGN
ncbi:Tyr recombinase domain-containing protein [Plasmodiophora brassicae]|uniref:Uncharacterized protein n=1 Tax=Plasmodiophora brassicae TaxID=37360 RepID=A0A3P3Y3F6_PLABS|nr:unnamed protein product [Plasmodiophora brassicae]